MSNQHQWLRTAGFSSARCLWPRRESWLIRSIAEGGPPAQLICMNGEAGEIHDLARQRPAAIAVASRNRAGFWTSISPSEARPINESKSDKARNGRRRPTARLQSHRADRRCAQYTPGIGLISPSNNHDLYSIEDLAQLDRRTQTANAHRQRFGQAAGRSGIGIIGRRGSGPRYHHDSRATPADGAGARACLAHVGLQAEIASGLAHRH